MMTKELDLIKTTAVIAVLGVFLFSAGSAVAQQSATVQPFVRAAGTQQGTAVGASPQQIRHAYGFDQISNQGAGQIIGIVEAFDHPQIEKDLGVFSQRFGLPACTTANRCFQKISSNGKNLGADKLWALEMSLDVEWAHAIAPQAQILVVESPSADLDDMMQAVDLAVQMGASVVSMSWGTYEFATETSYDSHFTPANVTFLAGSGDFGNPGFYPAASPFVTGVGGTTLAIDALGNYIGETAWSGSGGSVSTFEPTPAYQAPVNPHNYRGIPDVAYNGDPLTGFAVYDSSPFQGFGGWIQVAGTSAGPPQWAAFVAIANSMRASSNKTPLSGINDALYSAKYGSNYNDVVAGSNGTCGAVCTADPGYDYVTGLGSPQADSLINVLTKK